MSAVHRSGAIACVIVATVVPGHHHKHAHVVKKCVCPKGYTQKLVKVHGHTKRVCVRILKKHVHIEKKR